MSATNVEPLDGSQEMIALGLCNIFGSFFQSMPTSGSFSRSAVYKACDVKTPFSGIYVGIIIVIALTMFTPYFRFIPTAAVGSVLIMSSFFLVKYSAFEPKIYIHA